MMLLSPSAPQTALVTNGSTRWLARSLRPEKLSRAGIDQAIRLHPTVRALVNRHRDEHAQYRAGH